MPDYFIHPPAKMDLKKHVIIINGENKTFQVESIKLDGDKYIIKFINSAKTYAYSRDNVIWMSNPDILNPANIHVLINGTRVRKNMESVRLFSTKITKYFSIIEKKYYAIVFENGFVSQHPEKEVQIHTTCLHDKSATIFKYLEQCAEINPIGIAEQTDDTIDENSAKKGLLSYIYSKIDFVDDRTAAAIYLNPTSTCNKKAGKTIIFPFGCNSSQEKAVKEALANRISVIQGPPGTGKTQTILNIIANLLMAQKSILVVSNNNSATNNILEKLNKYGFGFLVAPLGKKENKEAFLANQPKLNPDIPSWSKSRPELEQALAVSQDSLTRLRLIYEMNDRLSSLKQELATIEVEKRHFEQDNPTAPPANIISLKSKEILHQIKTIEDISVRSENNSNLFERIKLAIKKLILKLRLRFRTKIKNQFSDNTMSETITLLELLFYRTRISELNDEINSIEEQLTKFDAASLTESLTQNSLAAIKAILSNRYKTERKKISSLHDLFHGGQTFLHDFPIVLSTTFSSKLCLDSDTIFDYVIMDEASQVSVDTGFLALTCAKNAVIVGDTMQLPNVITDNDAEKLRAIRDCFDIPKSYDVEKNSFLASILASIPNVPETLLREHYRCHPDIINFCNQKFYGGNLLIMTKRHDGDEPLIAIQTAEGQHSRGHYNQREIDSVKTELLPLLNDTSDIGIIAPYNQQVNQFNAQIPEIEAATVHKFQGREKDIIILSVTDDTITEFADNANLLNVAVSRAKEKFCLVITSNCPEQNGNLHDLLMYINYQNGTIIKSRLHSIYDYLFNQIHAQNQNNISEFSSENLTFELIERIRTTYPQLSHIKALCHYPMRNLIKDTTGLSAREIQYAQHPATHIDFLIINRVSKEPLLAIETDGYAYHNETTAQYHRDRIKDHILELYSLPMLRLSTIGHSEEERIVNALLGK